MGRERADLILERASSSFYTRWFYIRPLSCYRASPYGCVVLVLVLIVVVVVRVFAASTGRPNTRGRANTSQVLEGNGARDPRGGNLGGDFREGTRGGIPEFVKSPSRRKSKAKVGPLVRSVSYTARTEKNNMSWPDAGEQRGELAIFDAGRDKGTRGGHAGSAQILLLLLLLLSFFFRCCCCFFCSVCRDAQAHTWTRRGGRKEGESPWRAGRLRPAERAE